MRSKHLPRLWCALQGLLPLEPACVAPGGERGGQLQPAVPSGGHEARIHVAAARRTVKVPPRGTP